MRALSLVVAPAMVSLLAVRHLFVTEPPLAVFIGLFLLASVIVRYWWPSPAPAAASTQTRRWARSLVALVVAGAGALVLRTTVAQRFRVTSSSMLPTVAPGDQILANKLAYIRHRTPRRGDAIVFHRSEKMDGAAPDDLIKRVVGLPGDRIGIKEGRLVINDWLVPYCDAGVYPHLVNGESTLGRLTLEFLGDQVYLTFFTAFSRPFGTYRVGPDEVFVLGDNRNNSADSRTWDHGHGAGVPLTAIEGRVQRLLVATGRDGRADLRTLLKPLGLEVYLPGMDVRPLEQGIRECLKAPPASTWPPQV